MLKPRFALGLAATLVAAALLGCEAAQDALLERVASRLATPRTDIYADDAMRVLICGSASPLPHPTRARPCTAIFAAGKMWVVDVGPGSWNHVGGWRIPAERIGAVLLTHFHSDHIGELGEWNLQSWVAGRPAPLQVIGPEGVQSVVAGFNEAYALDHEYRVVHHGAGFNVPELGLMEAAPVAFASGATSAVVHDADGLRITAFLVDHRPIVPAVGYRFDWRGRSVVVSGDTVKNANLIRVAKDADVLVHEAQANHLIALIGEAATELGRTRPAQIMHDIPSYHTTPVQAAEVANEAGVRLLVLYHLNPSPPNAFIERVFVRGMDAVRPKGWMLSDDGTLVELPVGSEAVKVSTLG